MKSLKRLLKDISIASYESNDCYNTPTYIYINLCKKMSLSVIVHIGDEDPIQAEIDKLPSASDTIIILYHPRRRDGKDIHYLQGNVSSVIWPINQISFIEILPTESDQNIIKFFRD